MAEMNQYAGFDRIAKYFTTQLARAHNVPTFVALTSDLRMSDNWLTSVDYHLEPLGNSPTKFGLSLHLWSKVRGNDKNETIRRPMGGLCSDNSGLMKELITISPDHGSLCASEDGKQVFEVGFSPTGKIYTCNQTPYTRDEFQEECKRKGVIYGLDVKKAIDFMLTKYTGLKHPLRFRRGK